ncbi:hypothetical protein L9F63_003735, partial [Diploptera punctata]
LKLTQKKGQNQQLKLTQKKGHIYMIGQNGITPKEDQKSENSILKYIYYAKIIIPASISKFSSRFTVRVGIKLDIS